MAQLIHQVSKLVAFTVGGDKAADLLIDVRSLMPADWVWQPEPKDEPEADPHAIAKSMASPKCRPLSTPVQSCTIEVTT